MFGDSKDYSEGFENYIKRIPIEKLRLLESFMNVKETDAYLVLASNKEHLKKLISPSCAKTIDRKSNFIS